MKNKPSIKSVAKYIVEGPNSITKLIFKKKNEEWDVMLRLKQIVIILINGYLCYIQVLKK